MADLRLKRAASQGPPGEPGAPGQPGAPGEPGEPGAPGPERAASVVIDMPPGVINVASTKLFSYNYAHALGRRWMRVTLALNLVSPTVESWIDVYCSPHNEVRHIAPGFTGGGNFLLAHPGALFSFLVLSNFTPYECDLWLSGDRNGIEYHSKATSESLYSHVTIEDAGPQ